MVFLVVVVPEFGDDKDFFALDEAFVDGALYALACFALVLVVVCAVASLMVETGIFVLVYRRWNKPVFRAKRKKLLLTPRTESIHVHTQ